MGSLFSIRQSITRDVLLGKHQGIHNFSWGCLEAYFRLTSLSEQNIYWDGNILSISGLPGGRVKTWVFGRTDVSVLKSFQFRGGIYSQQEFDLPKKSQFHEIAYDLTKVFNPTSYPNKKKRYQRLRYPFQWLTSNRFIITNELDLLSSTTLHDRWVEWKLEQPTTYRLMFPRKRYLECIRYAMKYPEWYVYFGCRDRYDNLVAVRVLYVEDNCAFDLANFSSVWNIPSQLSEYFSIYTMRELYQLGITTVNCGASLNKGLSQFKHHWPSFEVKSWMYSQI